MPPRHGGRADDRGSVTPAVDAEPHSRSSGRPESAYGSTRLRPTSVQVDVAHVGDIFVARSEAGVYSSTSLESSIKQDTSFPNTQLGTPSWLHGSVETDVAPWFPGSRIDPNLGLRYFAQDQYFPELLEDSIPDQPLNNQPFYNKPDDNPIKPSRPTTSLPKSRDHLNHHSKSSKPPHVTCEQCHRIFTGQYRAGNCSRHVRQQHPELLREQPQCICRVCKKVYKRQDARRKHEWQRHALLDSKPSPRKPACLETKVFQNINSLSSETYHDISSLSSLSHDGGLDGISIDIPAPNSTLPSVLGKMQDPRAESSTRPSSQDYSRGFSSFFGSSRTSASDPDIGSFENQAQPPPLFLDSFGSQTFAEFLDLPPLPDLTSTVAKPAAALNELPNNARPPWLSFYDVVLGSPGSSRIPHHFSDLNQGAWIQVDSSMYALSAVTPLDNGFETKPEQT
ncbi:uncharacterized protein K460DRAFT_401333 [Cucurbitaria berberidis CBS 394.84]|uniref:C2H2-type domain-containing protein n=1 Tax=Cucurbitaria berberidis CBS 394.84 TaxID=1168544 RepID=A0A9P4GTM9_9PLEO|nr:uncharacterized protein K460DRAFT_401333 [Cucurbitaria berberidis CBS 394.84]KAF1851309.1 hypothetical protein K460DRAFT_401333 [Cucurbitaria berberidis CBS 394.84]